MGHHEIVVEVAAEELPVGAKRLARADDTRPQEMLAADEEDILW